MGRGDIPAKKRKLVITADDVGLSEGINGGVEELIRAGRLKNVSVMVNAPAFGGALLLRYTIHRQDPVFIIGQGAGLFIYFRNVYIITHSTSKCTA